jgi:hypothetical protein
MRHDVHAPGWTSTAAALAVVAISRAVQIANGFLDTEALSWISIALAAALAGLFLPRPRAHAKLDAWLAGAIAVAGLAWNLRQLWTAPPTLAGLSPDQRWAFNLRLAALGGAATLAAAAALAAAARAHAFVRISVTALVAAFLLLGTWILRLDRNPAIDVHVFHTEAIEALRHGGNPYSLTTPNIYGDARFYGPGLVVDGRVQVGFPYPPLSLLLVAPAQIVAGDYRYGELAAICVTAVLIAFACSPPSAPRLGPLAAALFLTIPRIFFVLDQAWTDPLAALGLAAVVYAACRRSRLLPWLFGGFLAVKQYSVLALPAALLLMGPVSWNRWINFLAKALVVALVVTVPFFLWDPAGFWRSVVAFQFRQPFRVESLSYLSWWVAQGHEQPPETLGFAAAAIVAALAVWRLPRTPAGFAYAVAATSLAFFAFNKQAFCNYYFFVSGAFAVAMASGRDLDGRGSRWG